MAKKVQTDAILATKLVAGTNLYLANVPQLMLASRSFTPAELIAELEAIAKLRNDVDATKALLQAKLATFHAEMPIRRPVLDAFVEHVKAAFSQSPDILAAFGLEAKKARTPLTVEQKAAAAAKRAATRAARHVMGPRQRRLIKGDVTGVVLTPIVAPQP
jgi:hypothetical protein